MGKVYSSKIVKQTEVAEHTLEIAIARPPSFEFEAGQYIQLGVHKLLYSDPKGSSRVFSIASTPLDKDVLRIAFRNTDSGFKRTLSELSAGSEVLVDGPFGHFVLPNKPQNSDYVFIAGGIGITPFFSMIKTAVKNNRPETITLLYANRNEESAAYLDKLKMLEKTSENFSLHLVLGRINASNLNEYLDDKESAYYWVVGPPSMVAEMTSLLVLYGISSSQVRIEEFTGY